MEAKVSEILENILGLLALEGSFEVNETEDEVQVTIEANDSGRLIGAGGETLDALQLIVNQILNRQAGEDQFKRVVIDVGNWKAKKSEDLEAKAKVWAQEVKESGQEIELDPMSAWQRRLVHLAVEGVDGVISESVGEGRERHLVIRVDDGKEKMEDGDLKVEDGKNDEVEAEEENVIASEAKQSTPKEETPVEEPEAAGTDEPDADNKE